MVSPLSLSSLPEILPSFSVCILSELTVIVFLSVGQELENAGREFGEAGRVVGNVSRELGDPGQEFGDTDCKVGDIGQGLRNAS